jgi:cytochrome c-L
MGPNLIDDEFHYPRVNTDQGMFEVIYGGAAGAMQAFGQRIDQDEILKITAFVDSLRASQCAGK